MRLHLIFIMCRCITISPQLSNIVICCRFHSILVASHHGGTRRRIARQWSPLYLHVCVSSPSDLYLMLNEVTRDSSLNVSTKSFALVSATLLLLDYGSTAVVSAATAAAYLSGEVTLPFPAYVGAILVLVILTSISLCGIKESSRIALTVLTLHVRISLHFLWHLVKSSVDGNHACSDYRISHSLGQDRKHSTERKLESWSGT